jgi:hypothetical protein
MPEPKEICVEDLRSATPDARYLRCVALAGRDPGLRVDARGRVLWKSDETVACELWVSLDDRLVLYRPDGGAPVRLTRAGRSLDVPFDRPVILVDQDELHVGGRDLRVHVHGVASAVHAPEHVSPGMLRAARALGAAAAVGAAAAACGPNDRPPQPPTTVTAAPDAGPPPPPPVEIRDAPPAPLPNPMPAGGPSSAKR